MVLLSLDDPNLAIRFWKPYDVLSSFTDTEGRSTLADFIDLPGIYAAGRLDRDSEGLLLLTRAQKLRTDLMNPDIGHPRSYLVQVEGIPGTDALSRLERGVELKGVPTRPAQAEALVDPPMLPARPVPIRVRKSIPDSWIRLTLTEGRNRQVRKMTAAVGHPTLRLVRESIGPVALTGLGPGDWSALSTREHASLIKSLSEARSSSRPAHGRPPRGRRSPG